MQIWADNDFSLGDLTWLLVYEAKVILYIYNKSCGELSLLVQLGRHRVVISKQKIVYEAQEIHEL